MDTDGRKKKIIITIDGPAGAGKTTVSKLLAQRLGFRYIDTGALYRGIAYAASQANIASDDDKALEKLCGKIHLGFEEIAMGLRLVLNQTDITDKIRSPELSMKASAISARPVVRDCLLILQRFLGKQTHAVFEGRDMGTVVFPEADIKFYLDANLSVRATRRFEELSCKSGDVPDPKTVETEMAIRDKNDSSRQIAPLKPAKDAIQIDSTNLNVQQVVQAMFELVQQMCPKGNQEPKIG
ncbi:MAG: (d)CMP kinase [Desulfobacteraceae bacterium]|nr:(d)CMP kinase [Desulfobacteraceae bacterium]